MSVHMAWFPMLLFVLVPLAGFFGIITLLANRKTRWLGVTLLVAGPIAMLLFWTSVGLVLGLRTHRSQAATVATEAELKRAEVRLHERLDRAAGHKQSAIDRRASEKTKQSSMPSLTEAIVKALKGSVVSWKAGPEAQPRAEMPAEALPGEEKPAAAKRPAWVDRPAQVMDGSYQMVLTVGPYSTRSECDAVMADKLQEAVAKFAAKYVANNERDAEWPLARQYLRRAKHLVVGEPDAEPIRLPLDYLRTKLVKEEFVEPIETSFQVPMVQLYTLVEFDQDVRNRIDQQWTAIRQGHRLLGTGSALATVLLLLSVAYGYLRTDLATQGAYRWRLRLLSGVLIVAVLFAATAILS